MLTDFLSDGGKHCKNLYPYKINKLWTPPVDNRQPQ